MDTTHDDCWRLGDLTSDEIAELGARGAVLAVPLGSTEQHGPHLPVATDTHIAVALCDALAMRSPYPVLVAPAVAITASGEHAGFAGTLSIGCDVLEAVLVEIGRSATETFRKVLFVNTHGGNTEALGRAVERLRYEQRDVRSFTPRWEGDAHAGHVETSVQLALRPERVRTAEMRVGDQRPLAAILGDLRTNGMRSVAASGVLGDPTTATAGVGDELIEQAERELQELVRAWSGGVVA